MKSHFSAFVAVFTLMFLTACGGGGGLERDPDDGGTPTPTPSFSISMSITDENGDTQNELSAATPLFVTATVSDAEGRVQSDVLVTFSFSVANLAQFNKR